MSQTPQEDSRLLAERYESLLTARASDVQRNGGPPDAWYCVSATADRLYVAYVYEWTFSETPWWGQVAGYPGHEWDYEPILAEVDLATGDARYHFDGGHYRARSTVENRFHVVPDSHYYRTGTPDGGAVALNPALRPLDHMRLRAMHDRAIALPRLPFGRPLGLQWLCDSPARIVESGVFSADAPGYGVPRRIPVLAGFLISAPVGIVVASRRSGRMGVAAAALSGLAIAALAAAWM